MKFTLHSSFQQYKAKAEGGLGISRNPPGRSWRPGARWPAGAPWEWSSRLARASCIPSQALRRRRRRRKRGEGSRPPPRGPSHSATSCCRRRAGSCCDAGGARAAGGGGRAGGGGGGGGSGGAPRKHSPVNAAKEQMWMLASLSASRAKRMKTWDLVCPVSKALKHVSTEAAAEAAEAAATSLPWLTSV
ncbi:uncharacterized protein LOC143823489 [Paroedura picta]|uniref:uncharacterized protein LOC143823489 n=1 Tax=Paroedura picta TaxID=143630 RepID=UPI004056AC08